MNLTPVYRFVAGPLISVPGLTALLIAMGCGVNGVMMHHYIHMWIPPESLVLQLTRAVLTVWPVMWVYIWLKGLRVWMARVWMAVVMCVMAVNVAVDIAVYDIYGLPFSPDFMVVIFDTNAAEIKEFISAYIGVRYILTAFGCMVVFVGVYYFGQWLGRLLRGSFERYPGRWGGVCVVVLVACCWFSVAYGHVMGAHTDIVAKLKAMCDHRPVHENIAVVPRLVKTSERDLLPEDIVVIVGESLSRDKCQIYGYGKATQPRLMGLVEDSSLMVFKCPEAPASYTIAVFQNIIGTWDDAMPADSTWYVCPTLFHMARGAGYHSAWISNQTKVGLGDTGIAVMSHVADTALWTNDGLVLKSGYDEAVLPLIDSWMEGCGCPRLTFVHLQGSHMDYSSRYPADRTVFDESDYPDRQPWQREVLAAYDNSVLYNDSVVAEIINRFSSRDAMVIYFSDHGEDLYESHEGFYGHGKSRGTDSFSVTSRIPFVVYISPGLRRRRPDLVERIGLSSAMPLNTTDLTYSLMDVMGVEMADGPVAKERSFFNPRRKVAI